MGISITLYCVIVGETRKWWSTKQDYFSSISPAVLLAGGEKNTLGSSAHRTKSVNFQA